jgi:hypothetical protein
MPELKVTEADIETVEPATGVNVTVGVLKDAEIRPSVRSRLGNAVSAASAAITSLSVASWISRVAPLSAEPRLKLIGIVSSLGFS